MNDSNSLPRRDATTTIFQNKTNKNSMDNNVTRYTRGGKNGKQLVCPECDNIQTVYHFAWSGLTCLHCKQSVDKYEWRVLPTQGQLGSDSYILEEQSYVDSLLTAGTD